MGSIILQLLFRVWAAGCISQGLSQGLSQASTPGFRNRLKSPAFIRSTKVFCWPEKNPALTRQKKINRASRQSIKPAGKGKTGKKSLTHCRRWRAFDQPARVGLPPTRTQGLEKRGAKQIQKSDSYFIVALPTFCRLVSRCCPNGDIQKPNKKNL